MFEDLVGKNVEVTVSFSAYGNGASIPQTYYGTLLESTDKRIVLNFNAYSSPLFRKPVNSQGTIFINNNYIISITITSQ